MSLVPGRDVLLEAQAKGHAVGAFNFSNLEQLQAIVSAAEVEQTPVFLAPARAPSVTPGWNISWLWPGLRPG